MDPQTQVGIIFNFPKHSTKPSESCFVELSEEGRRSFALVWGCVFQNHRIGKRRRRRRRLRWSLLLRVGMGLEPKLKPVPFDHQRLCDEPADCSREMHDSSHRRSDQPVFVTFLFNFLRSWAPKKQLGEGFRSPASQPTSLAKKIEST